MFSTDFCHFLDVFIVLFVERLSKLKMDWIEWSRENHLKFSLKTRQAIFVTLILCKRFEVPKDVTLMICKSVADYE